MRDAVGGKVLVRSLIVEVKGEGGQEGGRDGRT